MNFYFRTVGGYGAGAFGEYAILQATGQRLDAFQLFVLLQPCEISLLVLFALELELRFKQHHSAVGLESRGLTQYNLGKGTLKFLVVHIQGVGLAGSLLVEHADVATVHVGNFQSGSKGFALFALVLGKVGLNAFNGILYIGRIHTELLGEVMTEAFALSYTECVAEGLAVDALELLSRLQQFGLDGLLFAFLFALCGGGSANGYCQGNGKE